MDPLDRIPTRQGTKEGHRWSQQHACEKGARLKTSLEGGDLGRADSVNNTSRIPHVGTREDKDEDAIGATSHTPVAAGQIGAPGQKTAKRRKKMTQAGRHAGSSQGTRRNQRVRLLRRARRWSRSL